MKEVLSRPVRENYVNEAMCGRQVTRNNLPTQGGTSFSALG